MSFYYHGNYLDYYYDANDPRHFASERVASLNELLLGLTDDVARSFGTTDRHIFQKSVGLYVQDSWKIKPNFTLEVGMRWDVAGALGERANLGANFLPDDPKANADGFVTLAQQPLYNKDMNNFGPRVGFAWDLFNNGKTVLRAGYSLNYDLPNFSTIHAPQLSTNMWSGARAGFYSQVPEGIFAVDITNTTPEPNLTLFNSGSTTNDLCGSFVCMATGVNIYG